MQSSILSWFSVLAAPACAQFPPGVVLDDAHFRSSLLFVLYASLCLFWIVITLFVYMLIFRIYHSLRSAYREKRKELFRQGVELTLLEEPLEKVMDAFRPRRPGDLDISQEVLLEAACHLKGPPFDMLRETAYRLGFMEENLRSLRSRSRHRRGRAMEALGILRSSQAIVSLLDILDHEALDLQLTALRALAAINDPVVLPYFMRICDRLPPALLPRLISLMLEFGSAAHPHVRELLIRHANRFSSRSYAEALKEIAQGLERTL
ncbi:MAG: hypothetical protein WCU88_02530 [Elusimicrobiota bacterium]|jgi:hypothetical protein